MSAPVTMKTILADVCADYRITEEDIRNPARTRRIAWPRQAFMWRCKQVKRADGTDRYSFPQIGAFLGGMDHTSVLHGVRRHEQRLEVAKQLRVPVEVLHLVPSNGIPTADDIGVDNFDARGGAQGVDIVSSCEWISEQPRNTELEAA